MKTIIASGKRKSATAKAVIRQGNGAVRINNRMLAAWEPKLMQMKIMEPLMIAGHHASNVDIKVSVKGGGIMGQAEAARLAIAKAIVEFTKDKKLEKEFSEYDRHLLIADVRRKEVKKPNRHGKARSKTQKSYR